MIQRLRLWGCVFQKPFLLYAPKETVFEIQRKALTGPWVRSSIDRRVKSGHTKRRFPLPLVPTKGALPAAHDRAPNAGACWQQACLEGPAEFYNCQQSGSENGELRASAYPNAGNRTVQHPILDSRNNGGPGVQALLTEVPPLGLKVIRAQPPACFCLLFARAKRRSPQGETLPRRRSGEDIWINIHISFHISI